MSEPPRPAIIVNRKTIMRRNLGTALALSGTIVSNLESRHTVVIIEL